MFHSFAQSTALKPSLACAQDTSCWLSSLCTSCTDLDSACTPVVCISSIHLLHSPLLLHLTSPVVRLIAYLVRMYENIQFRLGLLHWSFEPDRAWTLLRVFPSQINYRSVKVTSISGLQNVRYRKTGYLCKKSTMRGVEAVVLPKILITASLPALPVPFNPQ